MNTFQIDWLWTVNIHMIDGTSVPQSIYRWRHLSLAQKWCFSILIQTSATTFDPILSSMVVCLLRLTFDDRQEWLNSGHACQTIIMIDQRSLANFLLTTASDEVEGWQTDEMEGQPTDYNRCRAQVILTVISKRARWNNTLLSFGL